MSLPPKKLREVVFQMLYSRDMGHTEPDAILKLLVKELEISKSNAKLAEIKVEKILKSLSDLDIQIKNTSKSYDFNRIQRVERNILRLALYEMLHDEEIPPKVAIAESIRLARKFSTPESAHFINAILDAIYQESLGLKADEVLISEASKTLEQSEETATEAHKYIDEDSKPD